MRVIAEYSAYVEFELPNNLSLDNAFYWWVKWDLLCVIWKEGENHVEYEPTGEFDSDRKHPNGTWVEESE